MSRTYRRMDDCGKYWFERFYADDIGSYGYYSRRQRAYILYENQEWAHKRQEAEYHADGHWWNSGGTSLKEHSRSARRAKERKQLSKVYKCLDYDDAYYCPGEEDRERRHIRWVYD